MPIAVLLFMVLTIVLLFGAYNHGFEKGKDLGRLEEAEKYKNKIKIAKREVVVN